MVWEVLGPSGEPTVVTLLNGHVVKWYVDEDRSVLLSALFRELFAVGNG